MSLQQKIPYEMMLTLWAKQIDPLLANPISQGVAINSIMLNANQPKSIGTTLNRKQQGWFLTDLISNAAVWRTQPFNNNTLTLEASADTTVSIWVY